MSKLKEYREKINQIDYEMIRLFEQRMNLALKIGDYKEKHNLPIFDSFREQEVLEKNISYLQNKEYASITKEFFQTIMDLSKRLQEKNAE